MKPILILPISLILTVSCCINIYAATDSLPLPSCFRNINASNEMNITEYEYKGQRWFVMEKANLKKENYPDNLSTIKFYNDSCVLVCTWKKGGFAGFNKVSPDTVEKEKILKIRVLNVDTLLKNQVSLNALPDTIIKIAISKNVYAIQQYTYQGQILYSINNPLSIFTSQELLRKGVKTIDQSYYDKNGKVVVSFTKALAGSFMRAEHWIPNSIRPGDVIKLSSGSWIYKEGKFENETLLKQSIKNEL